MDHFYKNIQGWFGSESLYSRAVREASDGAVFVEVGAWKGQSAAYMGVEIANSGKKIDFHVIDWFKGSDEPAHHSDRDVREGRLKEVFHQNTAPVAHLMKVHEGMSAPSANLFRDNSVDFVFIDAAHDYDNVKADIQAWLPKVKSGGLLSGDDYIYFPGVKRAVTELLHGHRVEGVYWTYRKP
jgi:hypothetical protein